MIENRIKFLHLDDIKMPAERLRSEDDFEHANTLAKQIAASGLINPILIDRRTGQLIAGRHRFLAFQINQELGREDKHKYAKWTQIPCRFAVDPTPEELTTLELIENIGSKKMDWKEVASSVALIATLCPPNEKQSEYIASLLGWSTSHVNANLQVAKYLAEGNEMVAQASGIQAARNIIARLEERKVNEVSELIATSMPIPVDFEDGPDLYPETKEANDSAGPTDHSETPVSQKPAAQPFQALNADFLEFAKTYRGPRFNLLHCDFPYGIDYDKTGYDYAKAHSIYGDSRDLYFQLLDALVSNAANLVAESAHLIFWLDLRYKAETVAALESIGFKVWQHSLIWVKSDNAGVLADPQRGPRHIHETALFASRGDRKIVKPVGDSISSPTTRDSGHVSEKPLAVVQFFLKMAVDSTTRILDPTAGSFNSILAAKSLGAASGVGVELDPNYATRGSRVLSEPQKESQGQIDLLALGLEK